MKKYLLALDQGTTSSRAILFDENGLLFAQAHEEVACIYPKSGWVEQDPLTLWVSIVNVINEVMIKANITMKNIVSIGITNQRETTIVWNKKTGLPVYPAIVWQSRQTAKITQSLQEYAPIIHAKTGLFLNPYFSASKIRFILDQKDNQVKAEKGELLFGTVDSWLLYKLTNGEVHATDVSNASRTLLYNIFTQTYDDELLKIFNIPFSMLPEVKDSSSFFGYAKYFSLKTPITSLIGDQQASLFGHAAFEKGQVKNTYGTGCFLLMNTKEEPILSKNGLLTTIAWRLKGEITYAIEGSIFIAGAAIQWLRDELSFIKDSSQSDMMARKVKSSEGVYIVPSFVGLGAPYWDDETKGAIFGLTRSSNKYHFVRATLEAIAYQSLDLILAMQKDLQSEIPILAVDGGVSRSEYLMQFQADLLRIPLRLPKCEETTALGAAYLAGLYVGFYTIPKIISFQKDNKTFVPKMDKKDADELYEGWKKAVQAARSFK